MIIISRSVKRCIWGECEEEYENEEGYKEEYEEMCEDEYDHEYIVWGGI